MSRNVKKRKNDDSSAVGNSDRRAPLLDDIFSSHVDSSDDENAVAASTLETSEALSWRMDPVESLSDWTIEIVYNPSDASGENGGVSGGGSSSSKMDIYHVHKCHLISGSCKSNYFSRLFSEGGRFAESQNGTSRIELHELAAKAFPSFLDYMYCSDHHLPLDTENATAYSFLSKYFDMPQLRIKVKAFWKKDVRQKKACEIYYEHAFLLNESKIHRAAAEHCRNYLMSIDTKSRLVHVPRLDFWLKLVEDGCPEHSLPHWDWYALGTLVAAFCRLNYSQLDQETFHKLTSEAALPSLSGHAALLLLEAERLLVAPNETTLTSLQQRCIDVITSHWNDGLLDEDDTSAILQNQNGLVLSKLFIGSLRTAAKKEASLRRRMRFMIDR
ncbi:hypothetical protein MPSEU_000302900 [Mayamaea pseudoterrestris]|nr:hypothetical protein MPSEU_000302900 [Mayamaea pseudoterrestris]